MQGLNTIQHLMNMYLIANKSSTTVLFLGRHIHKIKKEFGSMKGRSNPNAGRPHKETATPLAEKDDEAIRKSINRSRKKLKQHFLCNFYENYTFITLTFADTNMFDITNVEECLEQFKLFKKRLTMHIKRHSLQEPLKWIGAIEFQDNTRNGAVHFHLVSNLTSLDNKELQRLWRLGSTDMRFVQSSAYTDPKIISYLSKGIEDPRLNVLGQRFITSHGLNKPHEKTLFDEALFDQAVAELSPIQSDIYTYESNYYGQVYNEEHAFQNRKDVIYLEEICE